MYHGFTDKENYQGIENDQGMHINVKEFRLQVEYLKKHYNIISLDVLIEHYISGREIPYNSVVITIDDGYKSSYILAYPILKEFGIPATIFLPTDFIDKKNLFWIDRIEYAINKTKSNSFNLRIDKDVLSFNLHDDDSKRTCYRKIYPKLKSISEELREEIVENLERDLEQKLSIDEDLPEIYRPLEWHEVLEMLKSGIISIGSHTCSHAILTKCNPENIKRELLLSRQLIGKKTGSYCRLFCYPCGSVKDFNHYTKSCLKELGYLCGLTTVPGMNDKNSDVFQLKRLGVDGRGDFILFIMTLSGIVEFLVNMKQSILNIPTGKKG